MKNLQWLFAGTLIHVADVGGVSAGGLAALRLAHRGPDPLDEQDAEEDADGDGLCDRDDACTGETPLGRVSRRRDRPC